MNKECETCIKRKTMFCPNSSECLDTNDKLYYQNRIMALEENEKLVLKILDLQQENKQLKERIGYLERSNNRREDEILYLRQELIFNTKIDELEKGESNECRKDS